MVATVLAAPGIPAPMSGPAPSIMGLPGDRGSVRFRCIRIEARGEPVPCNRELPSLPCFLKTPADELGQQLIGTQEDLNNLGIPHVLFNWVFL